jgi:hypothetical protein
VAEQRLDRVCSSLGLTLGLTRDLLGAPQGQCANHSCAPVRAVEMCAGAVNGFRELGVERDLDAGVRSGHLRSVPPGAPPKSNPLRPFIVLSVDASSSSARPPCHLIVKPFVTVAPLPAASCATA